MKFISVLLAVASAKSVAECKESYSKFGASALESANGTADYSQEPVEIFKSLGNLPQKVGNENHVWIRPNFRICPN